MGMRQQDGQLKRSYNHYRKLASEYSGYLTRVDTKEPKMELAIHDTLVKTQEQILEKTLDLFDKQIQQALERPSSKSISSKHSKSSCSIQSRASAFSTQKRTKASAAQARVQFAMKESNIKKQCALLDERTASVNRRKIELEADSAFSDIKRKLL